ncbi:MAG: diaminopimelate epimerase [Actinomycetota bacterium]|nr:diaminopimelate epimerase [Actinomycetota bacterium]
MTGVAFVKGHGTQNDFVLLPDLDGALELTPARVRALCDRRRGLGADGVLRVVRTAAGWDLGSPMPDAEWFMDYRNADGSVAEMCGNGARVFVRYLASVGLVSNSDVVPLATRGGIRRVWFSSDGELTVDMGAVRLGPPGVAMVGGRRYPGVSADAGNPHLVCITETPLASLDLSTPPAFDAELFPYGVNIELVTPVIDGAVSMRVHERGVGETRSCGTGAVAVAGAVRGGRDGELLVHVLGGRVRIVLTGGDATLTGPAELVASGELDADWWLALDGRSGAAGETDRTARALSATMAGT